MGRMSELAAFVDQHENLIREYLQMRPASEDEPMFSLADRLLRKINEALQEPMTEEQERDLIRLRDALIETRRWA